MTAMCRLHALLTVCLLAGAAACRSTASTPDVLPAAGDSQGLAAASDSANGKGTVDARAPADGATDAPADATADPPGTGTDATRDDRDGGADLPLERAPATPADDANLADGDHDASARADGDPRGARDVAGPEAGREADAGVDAAPDASGAARDAADATLTTGDGRAADTDGKGTDGRDAGDARFDAEPDAGPFLVRGASRTWHVTSTVTVDNGNAALTSLVVILPAPQTNLYQDVTNLGPGAGTLLAIPDSDDFYVRFAPTVGLPRAGSRASYAISYDVTLYDLSVDFGKVTDIPPYDPGAADYVRYTGARGVYVDPDHPTIVAAAASLAAGNPDVLGFARAAYRHVASRYQYLNPNTGLHPLSEILAAGGGDCGNLASIYVSLLRHRGIPARHLVAVRPDGSYHVWADFLLAGHGWVPVDVTFAHDDPAGDYFGKVALATNGIIMDKQVWLPLDLGGSTTEIALLQSYAWWFWTSSAGAAVTTSYDLTATAR